MTLDPAVKDKWGIPVSRFHWKWSSHELNQAVHAKKTFAAIIEDMGGTVSGSTDFKPERSIQNPGYIIHEVGGAICGENLDAVEDGEAIELVRLRLEPTDCELWCGTRKVAIVPHSGGTPIFPSSKSACA